MRPGRVSPMKMAARRLLPLLLYLALFNHSLADSLMVTTNGNAVWVSSTRTDGDNLRYTVGTNANEHAVPQSSVAAVLPGVEKGKTYTPQDVESATNMIRKVERRFPRIYRQTNALRQDWGAVGKPDTGAEARIDEILSAFAAKGRSPAAYTESRYRLEMIRFRDKQGLLTNKLDAAIDRLHGDFFRSASDNLAVLVAASPPSLTNYAAASEFADLVLSCQLTEQERTSISESVRKCLATTLDFLVNASVKRLAAERTVDAYLAARSAIAGFRCPAGATRNAQTTFRHWESRLTDTATNVLQGYDLSFNGFPLNEDDKQAIAAGGGMETACATGAVSGMVLDEQCLMIVTQALTNAAAGERLPLPLRIVFGYSQPTDRQFGIAGVLKTGRNAQSPSVWKLPGLGIRDGHADIRISLATPPQQPAQAPGDPMVFHLFLVYRNQTADALAPSWTAVSKAVAIPLR